MASELTKKITIELPDTISWATVIRDFQLMVAMKEGGFCEPNNLERLGIAVVETLLKEGKLKGINEKKKLQRKKK